MSCQKKNNTRTNRGPTRLAMQELNGDAIREHNAMINQVLGAENYLKKIDDSSCLFSDNTLEKKAKQAIINITKKACEEQVK